MFIGEVKLFQYVWWAGEGVSRYKLGGQLCIQKPYKNIISSLSGKALFSTSNPPTFMIYLFLW